MQPFALIAISFLTSTATAIVGVGGGLLLVSLLPGMLPVPAVIPVHGVVQLASNVSRAALGLREIAWKIVAPFAIGSLVGAVVGAPLVQAFPLDYLAPVMGGFILLATWLPRPRSASSLPGRFAIVGLLATALSLLVGATGPLTSAMLYREQLPRDRLVTTHAVTMAITHALKLVVFGYLGFSFVEYLPLMLGMIAAVSVGSLVGTRLRSRVPEKPFRLILKLLLTLLALRLLLRIAT